MNVIFVGTPEFAVPSLSSLATSKHKIIAVITQPDRPKGRSKTLSPPPIKEASQKYGLTILQPENINNESVVKQLQYFSPDCIIVVAFGQFLSGSVLPIPRYQCINIHASLLPKFRGAAPINRAIIQGETITGVTSMVMTVKMDAGDIIARKTTLISPSENAGELETRLSTLGADLLLETLDSIETGKATYTKQDEKAVCFAPKLKKEDGLIQWSQETKKIHNLIRGITPAPGAYTYYAKEGPHEKKRIIVQRTQIHAGSEPIISSSPGMVTEIAPCGIHVATWDGCVCIMRLQPEGKRAMDVHEYLRGHKIERGDMFVSQ